MASLIQRTWTWANSGRRWGAGKPGVLQSRGSKRVGHDWVTEQQQQPVLVLGKFHGQRSLVNYSPWDRKESDMTEWLHFILKFISIEAVIPCNHLILCLPLLLLPSIFPSIKVFSNESVLCIRWPKYWSFSFSISPSNEYSGLISSRIDLFDLLVVQGTLKSLLQHHSSKGSNPWCSAFFIIQLSHLCMTTGKTVALTI